MASVINSARSSTASVFDFVGTTAITATQLIGTASIGVDMLHAKASAMHRSVIDETVGRSAITRDEIILRLATEHADLMEEAHKRNFPTKSFDREKTYLAAIEKIKAEIEKE